MLGSEISNAPEKDRFAASFMRLIKEGTRAGDMEAAEGKADGSLGCRAIEMMCFLEDGDKCPCEV